MATNKKTSKICQKTLEVPLVSILFDSQPSRIKIPNIFDNLLNKIGEDILKEKRQVGKRKHKWTQTDFRDSEAQTVPWEPSYIIKSGCEENCPHLQLKELTWGNGLPVTRTEVEQIHVLDKKRELEEQMPPLDSIENFRRASRIIAILEDIDWKFKEKEIQIILDIRMSLYKKLMCKKISDSQKKFTNQTRRYNEFLNHRRNKTVNNIRHKLSREIRKLNAKYKHYKLLTNRNLTVQLDLSKVSKYDPKTEFNLLTDPTFYDKRVLPTFEEVEQIKAKPKPDTLCVKLTKWNEENLKELHEELRNTRLNYYDLMFARGKRSCKRKMKSQVLSIPSTLQFESDNWPEDGTEKSPTLQPTATKEQVEKDLEKYRDLINELKSIHGLYAGDSAAKEREKSELMKLRLEEDKQRKQRERVDDILDCLEGTTVSGLLDFLNKELIRLDDERKNYVLVCLATRLKRMKDKVDSDDREDQLKFQEEVCKIVGEIEQLDMESAEAFLEGIIAEGVTYATELEVKRCISDMSDRLDQTARDIQMYRYLDCTKESENEVSNMLVHCLSPDRLEMRETNLYPMIFEDIFDVLTKDDCAALDDESSSCTCGDLASSSRTYTDETTQTWETFEDTFDEINEAHEIVCCIVDNILSRIEQTEEEHNVAHDILSEILFSAIIASN